MLKVKCGLAGRAGLHCREKCLPKLCVQAALCPYSCTPATMAAAAAGTAVHLTAVVSMSRILVSNGRYSSSNWRLVMLGTSPLVAQLRCQQAGHAVSNHAGKASSKMVGSIRCWAGKVNGRYLSMWLGGWVGGWRPSYSLAAISHVCSSTCHQLQQISQARSTVLLTTLHPPCTATAPVPYSPPKAYVSSGPRHPPAGSLLLHSACNSHWQGLRAWQGLRTKQYRAATPAMV
jgi:hypothetical protein